MYSKLSAPVADYTAESATWTPDSYLDAPHPMYRDMLLQRAALPRFTDDAVALVGGWARPGANVAEPGALARGKAAAGDWIVRRGFDFVPAGIALLLISSMAWGPFLIPVPLALAMPAFHVIGCTDRSRWGSSLSWGISRCAAPW